MPTRTLTVATLLGVFAGAAGAPALRAADVYGQRFDADDQAQGSEFRVNVHTDNHQEVPKVAMAGDGRFAVVWRGREQDAPEGAYNVFGQRYAADGTARGLLP